MCAVRGSSRARALRCRRVRHCHDGLGKAKEHEIGSGSFRGNFVHAVLCIRQPLDDLEPQRLLVDRSRENVEFCDVFDE